MPDGSRLSDQVAAAMLDTILARDLRPGAQLPTERELGDQFGVSRTVIREAVRALIARGVVHARPGRGLTVAAVSSDVVGSTIGLYLHGRRPIPYSQVHEVREVLEVRIAEFAAERGTDAEITELWEICERMRDPDGDLETVIADDVEFHRALARMTHNELYPIVLDSLAPIMFAVRRSVPDRARAIAAAYALHRAIAERVAAHDVAGAGDAMRAHLEQRTTTWGVLSESVDLVRPSPPIGSD